ncbi:MAG: relaxase [Alphaproteobacteria bacterium]|nr:relaxase [Alphaproteobacteria bacterium]
MIPFGSQRGNGGDLAVHLQNAQDNEYVEIADLRGALAEDLNGAFAEWEAQAHGMTQCRNYLYSLSINPDQRQGRLTRDQYDDYISRAEDSLGLFGQPRAVVFHIKDEREHCHVVWSRIDIQDQKAIQIPFDRQKLMMVTRAFARDHGLKLPDGYYKDRDADLEKNKQLSLYEKNQQDVSGLTKEDRIALVTDLWRQSDSAKAFVAGLEQNGYMLATGRRPYILVDSLGNMNALPKLIGDNSIRTKDIRAFLEGDYPPDALPEVEEARALVAEHRAQQKEHSVKDKQHDRRDQLKDMHEKRRTQLEKEIAEKLDRQKADRLALENRQADARKQARSLFLAESKRLREQREATKPTGLAGFLARVTGAELLRRQLHKRQDRQRHAVYQQEKQTRQLEQQAKQEDQRQQHQIQAMELRRKEQALKEQQARETQSLEKAFQLEQNRKYLQAHGHDHGKGRPLEHKPTLTLDLTPPGRFAVPHKAKTRFAKPSRENQEKIDRFAAKQAATTPTNPNLSPQQSNPNQSDMNRQFSTASEPLRGADQANASGAEGETRSEPRFTPNGRGDNSQGRER